MKNTIGWALVAIALAGTTGCPVVNNLPAPGRVLEEKEPMFDRPYHLYVPSHYNTSRRWPLVVVCHGTTPYDNAKSQLNQWKGLGEKKGCLVLAPELTGVRGDFPPAVHEQICRQIADERAILSAVQSVKAAYAIEDNRVFLTGWSAGGFAVLFTGLRNPDVFRALAVSQGNFNPAYVEPCIPFLDRNQNILIAFGSLDPLKNNSLAALEWLRSHDLDPQKLERSGGHQRDPEPVYSYFADCVRHRPWIRIKVRDDAHDPMQVKFSVNCSFEPTRYLWDFGDKQRSPVATPEHRYEQPGSYSIRVALWASNGDRFVRQIQLQIPRPRLGTASTTQPNEATANNR